MSEKLAICRYNKNHSTKPSRLIIHENNCPDRKTSNIISCPYNPIHKMKYSNLESHKACCAQRPIIDKDVEKEMIQFILNNAKNQTKKKSLQDISKNGIENYFSKKQVVGLGPIKKIKLKKDQIQELNKYTDIEQSKIRILTENISEQMDCLSDYENKLDMNLDSELEIDLNFTNLDNSFEKEIIIQDSFLQDLDENSKFYFNEGKKRLIFDETQDYDPNNSDIYIDKKNKNNVSNALSNFVYYK